MVKIVITSPSDVILKTITLDKTNDAYLNAVNFCTTTGSIVNSYKFEYNGTKPEGNVGIDYWGYYNALNPSTNQLYVPDFTVPRYGYPEGQKIPGMIRTPNASCMQKGILKKITYPTRGYTEFTYEPHRSNGQMYGGLRISEIKSYDADSKLLETKWYKYGWNEDGNGRAVRTVKSDDYMIVSLMVENLYNFEGQPVNDPGNKTTSKAYYPFPKCSYFTQGSTVVYSNITEYTGSSSGSYGKTEYEYTDFPDYINNRSKRGYTTEIPQWSYTWKNGKLLRKTVKDGNGKTIYSVQNEYGEMNREDHINLSVSRFARITDRGSVMTSAEERFSAIGYSNFGVAINGSLHDYYNYYITSGEYAVKKSSEYKDGVTRITSYNYNAIGQVSEEILESPEATWATRYMYSHDYWKAGSASQVQFYMFQQNMLAPILEKSVYKNGTLLNKITNEYKDWGGFKALQYVIQSDYFEPRIKYYGYDCLGNPAGIRKDDTQQKYYLWGYKGQRVIAEIEEGSFSTLGQTFIDRVTKAAIPSDADMLVIEALRDNTASAKCRLTTYYYNTALELSRRVAPNGIRTSYEYDTFGRLAHIKDHNGKIMEEYQYDYKQ